MKKQMAIGLLLIGIVTMMVLPVSAKTVTKNFIASQDAYIDWAYIDVNYASEEDLVLGFSYNHLYKVFLEFEVKDLPEDAVVTGVKLEISVKALSLDGFSGVKLQVHDTTSFHENNLTAENSPYIKENEVLTSQLIDADMKWEFTLDHQVAGNGFYYFALQTFTLVDKYLGSHDWSLKLYDRNTPNAPELLVSYTTDTTDTTSTTSITSTPTSTSGLGAIVVVFVVVGLVIYRKCKNK